ncbi:MAG: hypothetical protein RSE33_21020 [Hafnia sp.]
MENHAHSAAGGSDKDVVHFKAATSITSSVRALVKTGAVSCRDDIVRHLIDAGFDIRQVTDEGIDIVVGKGEEDLCLRGYLYSSAFNLSPVGGLAMQNLGGSDSAFNALMASKEQVKEWLSRSGESCLLYTGLILYMAFMVMMVVSKYGALIGASEVKSLLFVLLGVAQSCIFTGTVSIFFRSMRNAMTLWRIHRQTKDMPDMGGDKHAVAFKKIKLQLLAGLTFTVMTGVLLYMGFTVLFPLGL